MLLDILLMLITVVVLLTSMPNTGRSLVHVELDLMHMVQVQVNIVLMVHMVHMIVLMVHMHPVLFMVDLLIGHTFLNILHMVLLLMIKSEDTQLL